MRLPARLIPFNSKFNLNTKCSTIAKLKQETTLNGTTFRVDDYTNITPKILSYMGRNIHVKNGHPLSIVRQKIVKYFYSSFTHRGNPIFSVYDQLPPVVSVKQNFDDLLIPTDHSSRAKSDCYYVNRETMLRAHMTAHQSELLRSGLDNFLMIGDVYRRDEIDSTHFPVFHQIDAVRSQTRDQLFPENPELKIFEPNCDQYKPFIINESSKLQTLEEMKQPCHTLEATKLMEHQLKSHLLGMVQALFGHNIKSRWVAAYFPFTHPSWELEIYYENNWMEVLGCGIVRNEILVNAGPTNTIAYAFGLGLERIAMALFKIPDIRLMWSEDSGFLSQFEGKPLDAKITYKAVSHYPQCTNDISFWLPENLSIDTFSSNDFYDIVRDVGGEIIEQVKLKDKFVHPKTKQHSLCYSIIYRHLERTLSQDEVNKVHKNIEETITKLFGVTVR